MSISNYAEDQILDAVFNNDSFVVAGTFMKLYIGDPGENCIANPATHTTRVASSWGVSAGGIVLNDAAITFTPMAANETISHLAVWDNLTVGNPLWYGALTVPQAVIVGGTLNFAIGAISVTLN